MTIVASKCSPKKFWKRSMTGEIASPISINTKAARWLGPAKPESEVRFVSGKSRCLLRPRFRSWR